MFSREPKAQAHSQFQSHFPKNDNRESFQYIREAEHLFLGRPFHRQIGNQILQMQCRRLATGEDAGENPLPIYRFCLIDRGVVSQGVFHHCLAVLLHKPIDLPQNDRHTIADRGRICLSDRLRFSRDPRDPLLSVQTGCAHVYLQPSPHWCASAANLRQKQALCSQILVQIYSTKLHDFPPLPNSN